MKDHEEEQEVLLRTRAEVRAVVHIAVAAAAEAVVRSIAKGCDPMVAG